MTSQPGPLFDSSFAALGLINIRNGAEQGYMDRALRLARRLRGGNVTAMSIPFAPEPAPTAHVVDLGEDQTTGPLPLGFEFEFFGVRYNWFDLSMNGFVVFGTDSSLCTAGAYLKNPFIPLNAALNNFIPLGWTDVSPDRRQVAYEVRGAAQRRRLVLSFLPVQPSPADGVRAMTPQLVLHERTGMIDVHAARQDSGGYRVDQEAVRFTTTPW